MFYNVLHSKNPFFFQRLSQKFVVCLLCYTYFCLMIHNIQNNHKIYAESTLKTSKKKMPPLFLFAFILVNIDGNVNDFVDDNNVKCFESNTPAKYIGCNSCNQGTFGQVSLWKIGNNTYAIKRYKKNNPNGLERELWINILIKKNNINGIPKYKGHSINHRMILMEPIFGDTAYDFFKKYGDLFDILKLVTEIDSILDSLHNINVYYIDWNPNNIMINNETGNSYLIDFGVSESINPDSNTWFSDTWIGTFLYWGHGFRYINYLRRIKNQHMSIDDISQYAIIGDKMGLAKVIIHLIRIICNRDQEIYLQYTKLCRWSIVFFDKVYEIIGHINHEWRSINLIMKSVHGTNDPLDRVFIRAHWEKLCQYGEYLDNALIHSMKRVKLGIFKTTVEKELFTVLMRLILFHENI